ncbi:MAG TPA: LuxR C-terminal-related transcriptional regulator [Burkholderiaceae bacterium]|nr:LuxR C-terminal-related transcriptional regulator [Burkholderiaceae bacterium]
MEAPLAETLDLLVRLIENQAEGMRCALLLADGGQARLRFVAAPNIPEDYKQAIEPYLVIAADMGSCGTAAYLRQPVYTRDTAADPLWKDCGRIAVRNGLRAIWSTPILADNERVLGTFAMYYGEPRLPAQEHVQLIDMAIQMARVAIEAKDDDETVRAVFDSAPRGIVVTDLAGAIVRANRAFAHKLGFTAAELRGRALAEISESDDHASLVGELLAGEQEVLRERRYRTRGDAVLRALERCALRRDASGEPRYVVTQIASLSQAGDDPLDALSPREREVLDLVVSGCTSKQIGARLEISPASVDTYRSRIMLKLKIKDLPALVRFAIRHGIASA